MEISKIKLATFLIVIGIFIFPEIVLSQMYGTTGEFESFQRAQRAAQSDPKAAACLGQVASNNETCRQPDAYTKQQCITAFTACYQDQTGDESFSDVDTQNLLAPTSTSTAPEYVCKTPMPDGYDGPLPECAFCGNCDSTDELVVLMINIGKFILSLLGTIAFVMFIYGGVTMIMSFGSTEKFKKGQNILVAAVVGVLIALSAYLAVDFILESLQVAESFRVVN